MAVAADATPATITAAADAACNPAIKRRSCSSEQGRPKGLYTLKFDKLFLIWLLTVNFAGAALTVLDKYRAKKGKWRIAEHTLFAVAFLGGGVGIYAAMFAVRHKTRHRKFTLGIPAILLLQALAVVLLCFFLPEL